MPLRHCEKGISVFLLHRVAVQRHDDLEMERDTQGCGRKDALHRASTGEDQEHGDDTAFQRSLEMDAPKVKGRGQGISPVAYHLYHSGSRVGRMDAGGWNTEAHHLPLGKTYQFFLLSENKRLTKIVSLTGNDMETTIRSECNPLSFNYL